MKKYTDGTIQMDEWDWRAFHELIKEGNMKPTWEQLEEKREKITLGVLTRLYYRFKIPTIHVKKV